MEEFLYRGESLRSTDIVVRRKHGMDKTWPFKVLFEPEPGKLPRFFFVDERVKRGPDGSTLFNYWYVHNGTVSLDALHRAVARNREDIDEDVDTGPRFQVFQAKNRTQVVKFLRDRFEPTYFQSSIHPHPLLHEYTTTNPKESKMAARPGRAEFLSRRIEQMQEELEYIEELPSEPRMEDDDATVIWWTARFPDGTRHYTYAAVRAGDGLWYTTGPRTPKGFAWADLIEWIDREARPVDGQVWVATEFEPEILP